MRECGYGFKDADETGKFLDEIGMPVSFWCGDELIWQYSRIGIRVVPDKFLSECAICGDVLQNPDVRDGTPEFRCSPAKHRAYYDAFDEARSRLERG